VTPEALADALAHYSDVVVEHGYNSVEANKFYARHCQHQEFAELADEVRRLEIQFRQPGIKTCYTPSIRERVSGFIQSMIRAVTG